MNILVTTLIVAQLITAAPREKQDDRCFIETLCAVKEKIRWPKGNSTKWSYEKCQEVGGAFIKAGEKHKVAPALLVAIAINESDLNEQALRPTEKRGRIYAHDIGIAQIRCVHGEDGKCTNSLVKGMSVKELRNPMANIDMEAKILANIRKDTFPCKHITHPWWAHYNWGMGVFDKGPAKNYPHRIAVLYNVISHVQGSNAPELWGLKFPKIKGEKERQVNKPVGIRAKRLYAQVLSCKGVCAMAKNDIATGPFIMARR